jgi:hypothetical protein
MFLKIGFPFFGPSHAHLRSKYIKKMQLKTCAEHCGNMIRRGIAVGNLLLNVGITSRKCHKAIYVLYSSTAREEEGGTALKVVGNEN